MWRPSVGRFRSAGLGLYWSMPGCFSHATMPHRAPSQSSIRMTALPLATRHSPVGSAASARAASEAVAKAARRRRMKPPDRIPVCKPDPVCGRERAGALACSMYQNPARVKGSVRRFGKTINIVNFRGKWYSKICQVLGSFCLAEELGSRRRPGDPDHLVDQRDQPAQQVDRSRRTAADVQVDRDHLVDRADHRIAALEHAAAAAAIADRHHPFRIGRRRIGALQRDLHVAGHRAGDQQHVGMARRGREPQAEPLDVVDRIVERMDFELAAVARPGIDLPDGDRAAEQAPPARRERAAEFLERRRRRRSGAAIVTGCANSDFSSSVRMARDRVPSRSS